MKVGEDVDNRVAGFEEEDRVIWPNYNTNTRRPNSIVTGQMNNKNFPELLR